LVPGGKSPTRGDLKALRCLVLKDSGTIARGQLGGGMWRGKLRKGLHNHLSFFGVYETMKRGSHQGDKKAGVS